MTLCGEQSIVNTDANRMAVASLRCKRWSCPDCFPRRLRKLKRECRDGNPTTFLTLTARATDGGNPHEAARGLVKAWRTIRQRLKREDKVENIQFMAVFEQTKQGWPHIHILARMPYVAQKRLSAWMDELMNSPIVDIRRVKSAKQAASYVAKYVSKAPEAFDGCKRYWRSLSYLKPAKERRSKVFDKWWGWERSRANWYNLLQPYIEKNVWLEIGDGFGMIDWSRTADQRGEKVPI